MRMTSLVSVGSFGLNKAGVGARGYQIYRSKRSVLVRWGRIVVSSANSDKFFWTTNPQWRQQAFDSEASAANWKRRKIDALVSGSDQYRIVRERIRAFPPGTWVRLAPHRTAKGRTVFEVFVPSRRRWSGRNRGNLGITKYRVRNY